MPTRSNTLAQLLAEMAQPLQRPEPWDTTAPYIPQQPPYAPGHGSFVDQVAGLGRGLAGPSALAPQMPWIDPRLHSLPWRPSVGTSGDAESDVPGGFWAPNVQLTAPGPNLMSWVDRVRKFGIGTQRDQDITPIPSGGAPLGNVAPPVNYQGLPNAPQGTPLDIFPRPNRPPPDQDAIRAIIEQEMQRDNSNPYANAF